MIRRFTITIFLFSVYGFLDAQDAIAVRFMGNPNPSFVFNSIAQYKTGISFPNYTRIGITVFDDGLVLPDYKTWILELEAGDVDIKGTPPNTLPLSTIYIGADVFGGTCASCTEFFPAAAPLNLGLAPPGFPQTIIDGSSDPINCPCPPGDMIGTNLSFATDWIDISYDVGTLPANNLLGSTADFYSGIITLTITMTDP